VVFFDKKFQRWSFLTIHWRRWSDSSKLRRGGRKEKGDEKKKGKKRGRNMTQ
jgi:hypothetical protein